MKKETTDCCKGHECDNCKICQKGRCCRNDNPQYKLPKLGDWDGPIYGELGVFNNNVNGKAECHCCGKLYGHLGLHVWNSHNLTADEYRAIFGLRQATGLASAALAEKRRQNVEHLAKYHGIAAETLRSFTPEQRKYHREHKGERLEVKKQPEYKERKLAALKKAYKRNKQKAKAAEVYGHCALCQKRFQLSFSQRNQARHVFCSKECYWQSPELKQHGKQYSDNLQNGPKERLKYEYTCLQCRVVFQSSYRDRKYCSQQCYTKSGQRYSNLTANQSDV